MLRKLAAVLFAATALIAGTASAASAAPAPDFRAEAQASGLSATQADTLQARVNAVLAAVPGGTQISATEVAYDGMIATVDLNENATAKTARAAVACSYGWFCIVVRGTTFSFYECKNWDLNNWTGNSSFNNNQSPGTVFRAYDQNWSQIWTSTAPQTGTVNVTPWWHIRPC